MPIVFPRPSEWQRASAGPYEVLVEDLKGDSSYQNTVELMAVVWGLAGLGQLGFQNCGVRIRGDSETVLRWTCATRESFGSTSAPGYGVRRRLLEV